MLLLIANDAPLGPGLRDHALKGSWAHYRESAVGGDFLLICREDDTAGPSGPVYVARPRMRAELFRMTTGKSIPFVSESHARMG